MYPLHDHDLDRLSREAAEHFEVEQGASGWDHLEKRLDQELPQKKKRRRFLFWLIFITATSGGALTGIIKYQSGTPLSKNVTPIESRQEKQPGSAQQNNPENDLIAPGINPSANGTPAATSKPAKTANNDITTGNNVAGTKDNNQPAGNTNNTSAVPVTAPVTLSDDLTKQPVNQPGKAKQTKPAGNKQAVDKTPLTLNYATIEPTGISNSINTPKGKRTKIKPGIRQRPVNNFDQSVAADQKKTAADQNNITTPDQNSTTIDQQANVQTDPENNKMVTGKESANASDLTTNKPENKTTPAAVDSATTATEEPVKKEKDAKRNKIKQPLEIGLVGGPDLSAVSFGPLYKTGYIFGLQLGYRFNDRWSVNTGVLYTKKYYQADSQYFHYKTPWSWPLDDVEGNCSMWEIPVNVRYDLSFNDKRRWFVSTGLSTYLMDKEYYVLNYYSASTGTPYPVPYPSDTNKNYFFSIWNFSAGLERSLGRHFSIQAEPYLKVPLTGLGTGSMRMNSYGMFFTLKYKPGFTNKRSDNKK